MRLPSMGAHNMKAVLLCITASAMLFANSLAYAETYPDPQLTAVATPESIARSKEIDAYTLGVLAYEWGYPLVRMERVIRTYTEVPANKPATSYRAPLNQIGWATELATPAAKDMPTANSDTLYMSAVVTLTEPYVLSVPDTADRYYVVNVFSMYQDCEHYIGRRATGTRAGRFAIIPPGWKGTLPAGVTPLNVTTDKVWLWGRIQVKQGEPLGPVKALQAKFDLRPLSQLGNASYAAPAETLPPLPSIAGNDLGFFVHLGYALQHNQIKKTDEALVAQFERIGLTKQGFDQKSLSPEQIAGLKRALADAPLVVSASITTVATKRNGWDWLPIDDFGYHYPLRALVAGPYLGGNASKEAIYPVRFTDSEGKRLNGANRYEITFDKAPPVGAFWSLTAYNAADKMLVENPIHRYKVGSDTVGLVTRADGSFTIPVQHDAPQGPDKANWLPAPEGDFYLILRMFQPSEEILSGAYPLPRLRTVK